MVPFPERKTCLAEGLNIGQRRNSMAQLGIPNLDQVEEACQARRWIPGSRHSSGEARKGFLLRD